MLAILHYPYSAEECRNSLMQFGVRDLTPLAIAQALSVMAKTAQGLTDQIAGQNMAARGGQWGADVKDKSDTELLTWNVDIFVQVLKDLVCTVMYSYNTTLVFQISNGFGPFSHGMLF